MRCEGRSGGDCCSNALVDPDECGPRLPAGLRPHVIEGGTVVGCCLLEIERIRPASWPPVVGRRLRAVAHRISVEWEDGGGRTVTGVFVPVRHTDSRLAVALGGRWFPGIHERTRIEISSGPSTCPGGAIRSVRRATGSGWRCRRPGPGRRAVRWRRRASVQPSAPRPTDAAGWRRPAWTPRTATPAR